MPNADNRWALVLAAGDGRRLQSLTTIEASIAVPSNVYAVMAAVPVFGRDTFLSFLALSHAFERTVGYYLPMVAGATVVFARSVTLHHGRPHRRAADGSHFRTADL